MEKDLEKFLKSKKNHNFEEFRDRLNGIIDSKDKAKKCKLAHGFSKKEKIARAALGVQMIFDKYRQIECDHVSKLNHVKILI